MLTRKCFSVGLKMSVEARSHTNKIRKGGLVTKRGSEVYARKKEVKKSVRQACCSGSHNLRAAPADSSVITRQPKLSLCCHTSNPVQNFVITAIQ